MTLFNESKANEILERDIVGIGTGAHINIPKKHLGKKARIIITAGDNELCEAEVRKNLILVELGKPLTIPLAKLNRNCNFKREWDKIQRVWHGRTQEEIEKRKEYIRVYNQRPEVKEKKKENMRVYNQRPEIKERNKEYNQQPEVKENARIYYQRPDVKENARIYYQRPDVKEKKKEYDQEYNQRTEVKEKQKEYKRVYYLAKKKKC